MTLKNKDKTMDEQSKIFFKSLETIIETQTKQQRDIGSIVEAISTLKDSVAELAKKVNSPPTVNWVGIGSLIISLIAAAAFYAEARLRPLEKAVDNNLQSVSVLEDRVSELRGEESKVYSVSEKNETDLLFLRSVVVQNTEKLNKLDGKVEAMNSLIEDIDKFGSRKWNFGSPTGDRN